MKFDADTWVKIIADAGMKYLVITSKHHDGFAIWDSEVSEYDIVDFAPYGKDILKDLSRACKAQGIKFGLFDEKFSKQFSLESWVRVLSS